MKTRGQRDIAAFGAGCFWSIQYIFSDTNGVIETAAGYMGGDEKKYPNPSYEQVCANKTRYAEIVQVIYNPKRVSYEQLLDIFWQNHDPTTPNRQGPDFGTQYRSVIFYHNTEQKNKAEKSLEKFQEKIEKKIVTQIAPASAFYKAEEHHQDYVKKHGEKACHFYKPINL
ncbi:MAG: peptide-methionine (S)-S-oxide reductase MsrA [Nanoarchaeota archaeon]